MLEEFSRTEMLIGEEGLKKLQNSKVVIFGIGGVGSCVVEGLVRAGIGKFILVDNDIVSVSNLVQTIDKLKEMKELPQILLMENVPEVVSDKNIKDFAEWIAFLDALGYTSKYEILNAKKSAIVLSSIV